MMTDMFDISIPVFCRAISRLCSFDDHKIMFHLSYPYPKPPIFFCLESASHWDICVFSESFFTSVAKYWTNSAKCSINGNQPLQIIRWSGFRFINVFMWKYTHHGTIKILLCSVSPPMALSFIYSFHYMRGTDITSILGCSKRMNFKGTHAHLLV